jgi:hypothetical protein
MITIETTIEVDEEGNMTGRIPAGLKPGTHRAILIVFDESDVPAASPGFTDFPRHDVQLNLPKDFTFRREEMYGDDGR